MPAPDALLAAQSDALTKLKEGVEDPERLARLDWAIRGIDTQLHPVELSSTERVAYVGDFGPRHIRLEGDELFYQRDERPLMKLIPMGNDLFAVESLDFFRIEFVRDENGSVQTLVGHYENGRRDSNQRTGSS